LALPLQGLSPNTGDIPPEGSDCASIGRDSMIREISAHYLAQPTPLLRERMVHSPVHLLLDGLQRTPHAVSTRLPPQSETTEFVLPADMSKTEKRERLRSTQSAFGTSFGGVSPKFDKARLVWMQ